MLLGGGRYGLVYERKQWLSALEEEVTITKSPAGRFARRSDGTVVAWQELQQLERERHRARFGPMSRSLYESLQAEAASTATREPRSVGVYFQPEVDWARIEPALSSRDTAVQGAALAELEAATERGARELADRLRTLGLEPSFVGRTMPAVHVRGSAEALLRLREVDGIRIALEQAVFGAERRCNGGASKSNGNTPPNCHIDPVEVHEIDDTFNASGFYGAKQRVGIVEVDDGDCVLGSAHEAFDFTSGFHYSASPSGSCITTHGTQVASVISGSVDGTRCGASDVEFYYANDGSPMSFPSGTVDTVGCNPDAIVKAYQWFAAVGDYGDPFDDPTIAVVNESFGCVHQNITCLHSGGRGVDGVTQDYYARIYGMPVVKAAGNRNCDDERHEACPYTLNSICVGSASSAGVMSGFSSYTNPGITSGIGPDAPYNLDREEPDLVAVGGQLDPNGERICLAEAGAGWGGEWGTSYSAPTVSSLIALFREYCEPIREQRFNQRIFRALLRTASYAGNPHGPAYSTPKPSVDHRDGGGLITAPKLHDACDSPSGDFGEITIDLSGGTAPPDDRRLYTPGWNPAGETQSLGAPDAELQDFSNNPSSSDLKADKLLEVSLSPGDRLRYTWSWDACALDDEGDAPVAVSVDFDLFLYNPALGYVWGSQSLDDNNEGFDYTVQPGEGGTYQVWLMWPREQQSCEGTDFIPGAYAAVLL